MEQGLEQHIIARAVAGSDSTSFGRLVKIYQAPIRGFLRRLTKGNHSLADDLAQDTFLTAFRKISSFRNEGSVTGWQPIALILVPFVFFWAFLNQEFN